MARHTLAFALMCLLATHCAVEASRLGPVRKLSQISGGLGGVYAWNGSGIVVVNTVVYVNAVVVVDTGSYGDGTVVYLEGGIEFGIIYGGIIYPPNNANYYPTAIVNVVVFGPVFAQSWFFGPTRVICWSVTIFYRPGGERIYNPRGYSGPFYDSAGKQLGSFSNSVASITDNTIIQQNNVQINRDPPPQRQVTPPSAAGKSPISSAIGQQGVTVSPGAAPGFSPGDNIRSPGSSSSPDARRSGSPDSRSPGTSSSPDSNRRSGSPDNSSPDPNRRSGSPPNNSPNTGRSPAGGGSPDQNRGNNGSPAGGGGNGGRRDNASPDPDNGGGGGGAGSNIGGNGGGEAGGGGGGGGSFGGGGRGRGGN